MTNLLLYLQILVPHGSLKDNRTSTVYNAQANHCTYQNDNNTNNNNEFFFS